MAEMFHWTPFCTTAQIQISDGASYVSRISPAWDYNLYIGYLSLAFVTPGHNEKTQPAFLMVACTTFVGYWYRPQHFSRRRSILFGRECNSSGTSA
jgi:hypothetical protein